MFDISFSELVVIALVALLVIGPEKLPKVARTAGAFFGRMQRFVAQVKEEVQRESRFEALQQLQAEVSASLQDEVNTIHQHMVAPPVATDSATIEAHPQASEPLVSSPATKKLATNRKKRPAQTASAPEAQVSLASSPFAQSLQSQSIPTAVNSGPRTNLQEQPIAVIGDSAVTGRRRGRPKKITDTPDAAKQMLTARSTPTASAPTASTPIAKTRKPGRPRKVSPSV